MWCSTWDEGTGFVGEGHFLPDRTVEYRGYRGLHKGFGIWTQGVTVGRVRWTDYDSATCSVARTVEIVSDRWTVLILRDVFNRVRRFDELADHLGVPRDILTKRLSRLVAAGILERVPYQQAGRRTRYEYRLTAAGDELRPLILALKDWGDKHLAGPAGPPMSLAHLGCGGRVRVEVRCEQDHVITDPHDLDMAPTSAAKLAGGHRAG